MATTYEDVWTMMQAIQEIERRLQETERLWKEQAQESEKLRQERIQAS